ncbi:serpin B6-like isoform X2 [Brienomyrus brachyistius]|uniref:serpin B6-like isoform X2 n=1 Tax=Brienomyrus brachyistius TaxID=42636 RepID=UPI0020B3C438|nr:serpin B6-like isoform X2 [Brienomyrus brachyistius]
MESLTAANTHFSLDLFTKISSSNKGNVIFSPFSLSSALAMVYLGARGDTAAQMAQVLHSTKAEKPKSDHGMRQQTQKPQLPVGMKTGTHHFHKAEEDVHIGFSQLLSLLNKPGAPYSLSIANRLFGEQSYQFVEKFLTDSKKHYQAELEPVNFRSGAEAARVNINTWVEKQTNEKIKNLLAPGTIDHLTRLVLVNAIYFMGNWQKKFRPANTRETGFKINKYQSVPVMMMGQTSNFGLINIPEAKCQVLEMPYVGYELSMLIMLPNEVNGLEELEQKLTYENFTEWTRPNRMHIQEVTVSLPKFKLEETYDMNQVLSSVGMVDAFDELKCDFSGMSPDSDLVLSKVVHKAFVEVNEEGTEAAAATAAFMVVGCCASLNRPLMFTADHPFLFFIRHNPTKSILFYGRFCSPKA